MAKSSKVHATGTRISTARMTGRSLINFYDICETRSGAAKAQTFAAPLTSAGATFRLARPLYVSEAHCDDNKRPMTVKLPFPRGLTMTASPSAG